MAAFDLPLNNPALYSLSLRPPRMPPSTHPDLSSTSPRNPSPSFVEGIGSSSATTAPTLPGNPTIASASALSSVGTAASPTDVLLTLPPPILRLLVVSAPFIQFLTTVTQLLTWTHPNRYAPFILPLIWIAVSLRGDFIATYGLNALLLSVIGIGWVAARGGRKYNSTSARDANKESNVRTLALATATQPAVQVLTPAALNTLLLQASVLAKHLQVLHRTFSPVLTPFTWTNPSLSISTINFLLTSYPFYLLLTYFVSVRQIIMVIGLIVCLWEAPWFAVVRKSLWSSLLFRRTVRVLVRILQGDIRLARTDATEGPKDVGVLAKLKTLRTLSFSEKSSDVLQSPITAVRTASRGRGGPSLHAEPESLEIQYLFTIFENQRWWIGLEWTQALLPNERPSWSDPTHAPCSPPGAFSLPPPTTLYTETAKRTFTWKWLDPEWRIKGTAGVLISPSTIGANANPPVPATTSGQSGGGGKDLKDVMNTLGDWKSMLASRRDSEDPKSARRLSTASSAESQSQSSQGHGRKGSAGFFGDSINSLISAADGKPVIEGQDKSQSLSKGDAIPEESDPQNRHRADIDPTEADDLYGHPEKIGHTATTPDTETAEWVVDAQGWVYADNHWEKPTSKGGMGRYTRRRAWVRRAVVVERTEPLKPDLQQQDGAIQPKVPRHPTESKKEK